MKKTIKHFQAFYTSLFRFILAFSPRLPSQTNSVKSYGLTRVVRQVDLLTVSSSSLLYVSVSIHSRLYYSTFPLTISIYWRVSHFLNVLNVLNITHCSKHELDVDIIVRETKIWKFFVGILGHVCCGTNLHVLFNNSRLYSGQKLKCYYN